MKTLVRNNYLMVEEIVEQKKTKGGLLLSENDVKEIGVAKGKVLDVGPNTTGTVKVGDIAVYDKRFSNAVDLDGEIFKVIQEQYIIIIQREDD